ncbi:MBOAT family O-acyltransferase [uncultured Parabacteroides sp.]|uniref:MBOAT family O-acyltransferase n=1 Tax=uncultured Parabacteroides sp. TaxID=512312 RepID=UPI0028046B95|nr:MBOAT family O-acyltransferase [uncultured Parabacteroides sp.]
MLFNSITFLIFLIIVFILYWYVLNKNLKSQNCFILISSYIFYGWWDWRFLLLIVFTSFCSWLSGLLIQHKRDTDHNTKTDQSRRYCRWIVGTNIVINLIILGFFKYYNFFVDNFVSAFAEVGINLQVSTLKIILPVGISFYTFQALSYSIDVYRKQIEPTKDIISFLAFISFFPQLVAGPIERATHLLPQFYHPRRFDYIKAVDGLRQILWGFFKKVVVADNCAILVNSIFENQETANGSALLLGAILFTFQIYGDFSGYSDIALGTARLFGFDLMRNFNVPYFSRDIAEFWRRWHISLNTWFRDYIYIPLGGSRGGKYQTVRNTLIIFIVSGFWHGANWTYIIWGAYHGLLFLPLILLGQNRKYTGEISPNCILPSFKEGWQMIITFVIVMIGWIIFRATDIQSAIAFLKGICSPSLFSLPNTKDLGIGNFIPFGCFIFIGIMLFIEWMQRNKTHGLDFNIPSPMIRWMIYVFLIMCIFFLQGVQETFIYFQF